MNAVEIEEAVSQLAEREFDPAEFPFAFQEVFGNKTTTIRWLRSGSSNASDIEGSQAVPIVPMVRSFLTEGL